MKIWKNWNLKMIQHIKNFKSSLNYFFIFLHLFSFFLLFVKYLKLLTFRKYQISIEIYLGSIYFLNFLLVLVLVVDLKRQSRCILIGSQDFCFLSTTIFSNSFVCIYMIVENSFDIFSKFRRTFGLLASMILLLFWKKNKAKLLILFKNKKVFFYFTYININTCVLYWECA